MRQIVVILALMAAAALGWRAVMAVFAAQAAGDTDMKLTSKAFTDGAAIPRLHTGEGDDVSPPLAWSHLPDGTKSLALIVDDPDAPSKEPWVHWVAYNISADVGELPEDVAKKLVIDAPKFLQGRNSWAGENIGYRGPMPPAGHGAHHYHFHLYALDAMLDLRPGADKPAVLRQMRGHVLGECELIGTCQR